MPSTRDIRRRIRGVRNIKQVTRAMNMIASARLRRAQSSAVAARPYAERLSAILQDVQAGGAAARHPLLAKRPVQNIGLLLVTSDRGLCGAFNSNLIREAARFMDEQSAPVGLLTVGRKGRDHFRHRGATIVEHFPQPSRELRLEEMGAISKRVIADYRDGKFDAVHIVYAQFISVLKSAPVTAQVLPIAPPASPEVQDAKAQHAAYEFEPGAAELLDTLLPQYVEVLVYRAIVESLASEQAARMMAMQAATDSAGDIISNLTRQYNRVRQGSITTQLLEVVSGADALKKAAE